MEDQDTKDKILEGTEALFMKYGIRSVSMDDIARHLAVSKKTLYQHFADKDELVLKVSQVYLRKSTERFNSIASESKNAIEELNRISVCVKHDMEKLNQSMLFDLQKYHPKAWSLWTEHKLKYITEEVCRNLTKGIEEGYFRPELDKRIMGVTRTVLIEAAFNDEIFSRDQFDFVTVQLQLFELFVYGICTEKGKKLYQKYKESNNPQLTNTHEAVL